jgi:hypothetical protein
MCWGDTVGNVGNLGRSAEISSVWSEIARGNIALQLATLATFHYVSFFWHSCPAEGRAPKPATANAKSERITWSENRTAPKRKEPAPPFGGIGGGRRVCAVAPKEFAGATDARRSNPDWSKAGGLYGFVFQNPRPIAYHACPDPDGVNPTHDMRKEDSGDCGFLLFRISYFDVRI